MKKKGFTLVELLAVIVILAVILVIAIPQIMNTIKTARLSSFKDSAILIATNAEKDYLSNKVLNPGYNETSIPCSDVAKLNDDYEYCNVTYEDGKAKVLLNGKTNGKFSNIYCSGTINNMECKEGILAVAYLKERTEKKLDGLIIDDYGDIRYQGGNDVVKNYVKFNNETWRLIGIFDVEGEDKIKLVNENSIGTFSWDSSSSEINNGWGRNVWISSRLMNELNGDYINSELTENKNWYNNWLNSLGNKNFDKDRVLSAESQKLIDIVPWYLGGNGYNINSDNGDLISLNEQYISERQIKTTDNINNSIIWRGKVGLIYPSDYGYASSNSNCKLNLGAPNKSNCKDKNWLKKSTNYWTISPNTFDVRRVLGILSAGNVAGFNAYFANSVFPSIYLKSNILISGEGTVENPYVFSK